MSALPPKADMCSAVADVRFGPIADITQRELHVRFVTKRDFSPSHCCFFASRLSCGVTGNAQTFIAIRPRGSGQSCRTLRRFQHRKP